MSENNGIKEPLNKNNKVTKLRFPSFKDDLKKTLIEDICTNEKYSFTGGPFGSNLKVGDYTQSGVRVIQLNNINDIYFNDDNKVFVSVEKADSLKSCNAYSGDLIFAKMMPAGRLCILPKTYDRYLLGSDAIRLKPNIDKYYCFFLLECLNRTIIRNSITSKTSGSTRQRIGLLDLKKTSFYCPNYIEQKQIGLFFELIESKISNISKKINILKKYKEGIEKYAYKFVENQGVSIKFSDFFDNLIEKNNHNFLQYTIGKNGIKKIDEIKYDISNHKVFKKFNVIIGIGIDEIGINKDLEYGSVSPVYDVYNIRNFKYFDSIYITLKEQLWKKRNFITRKSTRREFEVDKYELEKTTLKVVDNKDFINVYQSITNIKKVIEILNFSFNNLKIIKSYILRHMFI